MSDVIADAAVREQALDPQHSFIVQAPAGSGKTELLTRRILTLLARVDEPEEILAITFTRKAASEMRQRVIRTLREAASGLSPQNDYEREGRALAEAVLARDSLRNWQLLENPSRLAMQTIDSLCSSLTRQLPVTSNFGAPLDVLEDARQLYLLAAERCIENSLGSDEPGYDALRKLLGHLDNNAERLQRLLADMLGNRDQWLRHYHQAGSREKLEQYIAQLVAVRFDALAALLPMNRLQGLPAMLRQAAEKVIALGFDSPVLELADLQQLPPPSYHSARIWQQLAHFIVTQAKKGTFRVRLTRKEGFPTSAADAAELGTTVAELKAHKQSFAALLKELSEIPGLEARLKDTRVLPVSGYSDEQWEIMSSLLELLRLSVAELHFVFAGQGSVDFTETALRASAALGDEQAPTDLALALDYRLSHILVDEFQDTSISQYQLFSKLVAGWQPDDGRTFFAVGDPMQSIYRFRDAEVSLFLRASRYGIAAVRLIPLQLEVNFRSDRALVQWCNTTFSAVFPAQPDESSGAIPYAHSSPVRADSEFTARQFHAFVDSDYTTQADWLAELVSSALDTSGATDGKPGSIAILVRSKNVTSEIFRALQQRNIAYQAVDIETLGDRLVVRDILSLCRALQHPQDRVHWLAVLRAPWCGLRLHDLHALVDGRPGQALWPLMCDEAVLQGLSDDARERLERLRVELEPALQRSQREPLVPWVEALWLRLGGPASCQLAQDLLAAEACFAELAAIEQAGRLFDSKLVEQRMNNLFAPAAQGENVHVQIMTIHKSKGLEFDTVIVPALDRRARADETKLLNWFEYFTDSGEASLLLAPIPQTNVSSDASPVVSMVKNLQNDKSANELLRLLYVATTRAKRQLHLLGNVNLKVGGELSTPQESSLLAPLWQSVQTLFEAQSASRDLLESEIPAAAPGATALQRIRRDWRAPELPGFWRRLQQSGTDAALMAPQEEAAELDPVIYDWAGAQARHSGTVVHRQLQRIAEEGLAGWTQERVESLADFYQAQLRMAGVASEQLENATALVVKALGNVLNDQRGQWLLSDQHRHACSEFRLSGLIGEQVFSGVIDRTFVDDNDVRWIVDFKTGSHKGKNTQAFLDREQTRYQAQLERYAGIMRGMDEREIRLGLYFPLLGGWREWQYNAENTGPNSIAEH